LALYQGLGASIVGITHALIYFPLYENSKTFFKNRFQPDEKELGSFYIAISAMTCKVFASFSTYPHEVLRAR